MRFRPCVLAHPPHRCAILTVRIRTHPGQGVVVSARFPKGGWSYPHTPRMGGRGVEGRLLAPGYQLFNFFRFSTFRERPEKPEILGIFGLHILISICPFSRSFCCSSFSTFSEVWGAAPAGEGLGFSSRSHRFYDSPQVVADD